MVSIDKVNIDKVNNQDGFRIILSPNCSISWRELVWFYVLTCVVAIAIGILFTFQGLWLVLPFTGIEMLALGACLYLTSRKVYRREVITLSQRSTIVEKGVQKIDQSWEFETPWLRLIDEPKKARRGCRKLAIGCHGNYVELGSFLDNSEKDSLAFQLKDCIIRV